MELLESVIPIGKKNAIHQTELAALLGVSTDRTKKLVKEARQRGVPILSAACGYWISNDASECRAFANTTAKQAFTRLKTKRAIENTLQEMDGQLSFTEEVDR